MAKDRDKVPYAKPLNRKLIGRGGPRDMQRRQQNSGVLSAPKIESTDLEAIKKLIEEKLGKDTYKEDEQIISPEEVEKRIVDAVEAARQDEANRYEDGLKNLNDQLNAAKIKIGLMEKELEKRPDNSEEINTLKNKIRAKDAEIKRRDKRIKELEDKLSSNNVPEDIEKELLEYRNEIAKLKSNLKAADVLKSKIKDKDEKISSLKSSLIEKEGELKAATDTITRLEAKSEKSTDDLIEMKATMELMFEKITSLQFVSAGKASDGKPSIDDHQVFIDPTEEKEGLESHIDTEASSTVARQRDVRADLNKLRNLVGKGKYKPTRAKSDLLD